MPINQHINAIQHMDGDPWPVLPASFAERIRRFCDDRLWQPPLLMAEFLLWVPASATVLLVRHLDGTCRPLTTEVASLAFEQLDPVAAFVGLTGETVADPAAFRTFGQNWYEFGYRHGHTNGPGEPQRCLYGHAAVFRLALTPQGAVEFCRDYRAPGQTLVELDLAAVAATEGLHFPHGLRCREILTHYLRTEKYATEPAPRPEEVAEPFRMAAE